MKINKTRLKVLIRESIRQSVRYQNENISITDEGNVVIRGREYELSVYQGFGVYVPVEIENVQSIKGKLIITGGALGITETDELKADSVAKITNAIESGKKEFVVTPPKGEDGNTIKFKLV